MFDVALMRVRIVRRRHHRLEPGGRRWSYEDTMKQVIDPAKQIVKVAALQDVSGGFELRGVATTRASCRTAAGSDGFPYSKDNLGAEEVLRADRADDGATGRGLVRRSAAGQEPVGTGHPYGYGDSRS